MLRTFLRKPRYVYRWLRSCIAINVNSSPYLHERRFRNVVPAVIGSALSVSARPHERGERSTVPDMNYDDIRRGIVTLEVPRGREIMVRREEIPVVFGLRWKQNLTSLTKVIKTRSKSLP